MENLENKNVPSEPTPAPVPPPAEEQEPLQIAEMKKKITIPIIIGGVVVAIIIFSGIIFAINYFKPKPYLSTVDDKPSVFEPLAESPTPSEATASEDNLSE